MSPRKRNKTTLFVTFEGIDGCGKTTQAILVYKLLKGAGYQIKMLREPGSTQVAERIRKILLDPSVDIGPITELLLYEAARADVTASEIAPALGRGEIVLCDRFFDSTTAYQGFGRGLDVPMVRRLHRVAVGPIRPDLTLLFDIDLATATHRRKEQPDRLELQSSAFFDRVRRGFLEIARKERRRVKVVDATGTIDDVFAEVRKILSRRIELP